MIIVTHNDRFHADDVFAMATLRILFGEKIQKVIRTRDEFIIRDADIVFDVGGIYDPDLNRFDHHQIKSVGERENKIPYAAFGLVWKKWGAEICKSQDVANLVEKKIVQPIDAGDNGFSFYDYKISNVKEYVMDSICGAFGSTWKEENNYDETFFEIVDIAEKILRREIKIAQDKNDAIPFVEEAYLKSEDKRIIVLENYYPWHDTLSKYEEILFVIFPSKDKDLWRINAVQEDGFKNKKDFPSAWSGLRDGELEKVSGIEGAVFCHKTLFLAVTKTKEGAILLAKKAVEA